MQLFLTFDYELFFGTQTGTVPVSMIRQTDALLAMARKYGIPMTFFVDMSYVLKLNELRAGNEDLQKDYEAITKQIGEIVQSGCEVQLHLHPHWMRSVYSNGSWQLNVAGNYKAIDFDSETMLRHFTDARVLLEELSGQRVTTFRAGGWCIQPFDHLKTAFEKNGICADSSVFPGGYFESGEYAYDFRMAPRKSAYRFDNDVCIENPDGRFMEVPISSRRYSPLFYWRLYVLGRLFPKRHKMLGDGYFLAQPGRKRSVLTHFTDQHISSDGYYASALKSALREHMKLGHDKLVIIGHPKCNTRYSLQALEAFIRETHNQHEFTTFNRSVCN